MQAMLLRADIVDVHHTEQPLGPPVARRGAADDRGGDHDVIDDDVHTGGCSLNADRKCLKVVDTLRRAGVAQLPHGVEERPRVSLRAVK